MTTIAWRGHYLAGDRLRTAEETAMRAKKVFRVRDRVGVELIGGAGDSWDCVAYANWRMGGRRAARPCMRDFIAILVRRRGAVLIDDRFMEHPISTPFFAIGSGADYAIGAMAAGLSAREAVLVAARFDPKTGGGVDVVRL